MRRIVGNLLIGLGILLLALTVVIALAGLAETVYFHRNATEDEQLGMIAGFLFIIVLLLLEAAILLTGRHLRRSAVAGTEEATQPRRPVRPLPPILYFGGSIATAFFAAFLPQGPQMLKPLWVLVGQPIIFAQIFLGGMLGLKLEPGPLRQDVLMAFSLLYFLVLFYPVYRLLTMNRTAEPATCKRMTALLTLFVTVHVLIALALAALAKA